MNRRVVMIAALVGVLVLLAWYFLLWSPAKDNVDKAKVRTEAAENQSQQLRAAIRRLQDAQRNEPLRRAQLETLRTAIPDTPNLAQFILDANDAAARAGIDFISVAPSEPRAPVTTAAAVTPTTAAAGATTTTTAAAGATVGTVPPPVAPAPAEITLQLQIQGGYFQVLDFLNRLDRLPRLVVTDTVNVSADQNARLTVALTARMFVRAVPAGFVGAASTTSTTAAGGAGATTTTAAGGAGATTTTAAGGTGATTTTAGANP